MRSARRSARITITVGAAGATLMLTATACGTVAAPGSAAVRTPPSTTSLDTSTVTKVGTWAVVMMGGSAAQHDNFWQLFIRPAAGSRWRLATPWGTADNGGLVFADADGQSAITAFRPSQKLLYSPLARTSDGGQAWSAFGPLDARLASVPDAIALAPASRDLLALLASGAVSTAAPGYAHWTTLTTERALAATSAGRRCGLRELTAVSLAPSGTPLLAGACTHSGTAGIFGASARGWQAAGPTVPAALADQPVTVLRLTRVASQTTVLMVSGTGRKARLMAAWSAGNGLWAISKPFPLGGALPASEAFGPSGTVAVMLTGGNGVVVTAGHPWQALPKLPTGTATLAAGPGPAIQALAVRGGTLSVWQASPGRTGWAMTQRLTVPILYGSSG